MDSHIIASNAQKKERIKKPKLSKPIITTAHEEIVTTVTTVATDVIHQLDQTKEEETSEKTKAPPKQRKSKKDKEADAAATIAANDVDPVVSTPVATDSITNNKPKRGRKPNKIIVPSIINDDLNHTNLIENVADAQTVLLEKNESVLVQNDATCVNEPDDANETVDADDVLHPSTVVVNAKQISKKRGRKPKGGKIVQPPSICDSIKQNKPNIILHLKCFMKDLQSNNVVSANNQIESYNFPINKNDLNFDILSSSSSSSSNFSVNLNNLNATNNYSNNDIFSEKSANSDNESPSTAAASATNKSSSGGGAVECCENGSSSSSNTNGIISKREQKDVWKKMRVLEHQLHTNNISDKKSCCFWDSCEFDNPPVHIPKYFINDSYQVYGCFCSPECAVAHLMEENIDNSIKFERYHLLNHIYGKNCNYTRNIKPAPPPHYLLDRFYGNLNIQEYRSLLRKDRLFLIVDKPLTKILPELHEDNDDFILNNKIIPSNNYQIKKNVQKNMQKNIINEQFGIC